MQTGKVNISRTNPDTGEPYREGTLYLDKNGKITIEPSNSVFLQRLSKARLGPMKLACTAEENPLQFMKNLSFACRNGYTGASDFIPDNEGGSNEEFPPIGDTEEDNPPDDYPLESEMVGNSPQNTGSRASDSSAKAYSNTVGVLSKHFGPSYGFEFPDSGTVLSHSRKAMDYSRNRNYLNAEHAHYKAAYGHREMAANTNKSHLKQLHIASAEMHEEAGKINGEAHKLKSVVGRHNTGMLEPSANQSSPTVCGLAVKAADTGRVLMIQRVIDEDDDASGKWEMPGGHIEDDETPLECAKREWEEEVGLLLPPGKLVNQWTGHNSIYRGFVYAIPSEDDIDLRDRDTSTNPDGDHFEACAWVEPDDIFFHNPRTEIRDDFGRIRAALD